MYVTRHSNVVDPVLRDALWDLYERSYRRTVEASPTHELLFRSEFDAALADPTNRLWVLWDDERPIASTLIATDVGSTRYLSDEYFRLHHPDHAARGAVHYIMWVVVHPAHVARHALVRLGRECLTAEADEGALVVFDVPEVNQPTERGGLAEMMVRLANMVSPGTPVELISVQRYYTTDFGRGARHASRVDHPSRRAVARA